MLATNRADRLGFSQRPALFDLLTSGILGLLLGYSYLICLKITSVRIAFRLLRAYMLLQSVVYALNYLMRLQSNQKNLFFAMRLG